MPAVKRKARRINTVGYAGDKYRGRRGVPAWVFPCIVVIAVLGLAVLSMYGSSFSVGGGEVEEGNPNEAPISDDQDRGSLLSSGLMGSGSARAFSHIFMTKPLGLSLELSGRESPTVAVKSVDKSHAKKLPVKAGDLVVAIAGDDVTKMGLKELLAEINKHYLPLEISFKHPGDVVVPILGGGGATDAKILAYVDTGEGHDSSGRSKFKHTFSNHPFGISLAKHDNAVPVSISHVKDKALTDVLQEGDRVMAVAGKDTTELTLKQLQTLLGKQPLPVDITFSRKAKMAKKFRHNRHSAAVAGAGTYKHTFLKKPFGIQLKASGTGTGAVVKAVDDKTLPIKVGDSLLEVEATDVSKMKLKKLAALISSSKAPVVVTFGKPAAAGRHDEE